MGDVAAIVQQAARHVITIGRIAGQVRSVLAIIQFPKTQTPNPKPQTPTPSPQPPSQYSKPRSHDTEVARDGRVVHSYRRDAYP